MNSHPINKPPAKVENITFQLATPVNNRIIAPKAIAIVDVSPIEPEYVPISISATERLLPTISVTVPTASPLSAANCAKGVAPENPSTIPSVLLVYFFINLFFLRYLLLYF